MHVLHKSNAKNVVQSGVIIAREPARLVSKGIQQRLQKRGWKHRVLDVGSILLATAVIAGGLWWWLGGDPGRHIQMQAVVAPSTIVSGDDATLSIQYANNSNEALTGVTLTLEYPPYFALQDVDAEAFEASTNTVTVGDLAPGANGLLKIRGVMFGDVGGTQDFTSTLSYTWNDRRTGTRTDTYSFSPQSSALVIETDLPDQLVSGQRLSGTVTLTNTGTVTFPEAAIHTLFPDEFRLTSTSLPQRQDETWIVPELEPEETLTISYTGSVTQTDAESLTLGFEPSFVFGDERFTQDTLTETVSTIPPPITVQLGDLPDAATPGVAIPATVSWTAQSDLDIRNARVRIEGATNQPEWQIATPVTSDERSVSLIPAAATSGNQQLTLTPVVQFQLGDDPTRITIAGAPSTVRLTTTVSLTGFARYFTQAGDQLGRGPLPPTIGEQTIYWAVVNVQDTFNDLTNVTVTATLPDNVAWIGRQSVTKGSGVTVSGNTLTWNVGTLEATRTTNTLAAASFALGITPTANQQNTAPALLTNITIRGTDVWTGQAVTRTISSLSTTTPDDPGIVR